MSKGNTVTISVTDDEREALDLVVENVPLGNRHAIASAAFRVGLREFSADPARAYDELRGHHVRVARPKSRRAR